MPVKSNIELGPGKIFFNGSDEPAEIHYGSIEDSEIWAEDQEPYISINSEPMEFTFENVEINRDWTLVNCAECGQAFAVTNFYALVYGPTGWICPVCNLKRTFKEKENVKSYCNYGTTH